MTSPTVYSKETADLPTFVNIICLVGLYFCLGSFTASAIIDALRKLELLTVSIPYLDLAGGVIAVSLVSVCVRNILRGR